MNRIVLILLYAITSVSALVMLKFAAKNGPLLQFIEGKVHLNLSSMAVFGVFSFGISFVLYTYLISKYDLGYIIPLLTALVYVLIFVASYFFFQESINIYKIFGVLLILSGITLLSIGK